MNKLIITILSLCSFVYAVPHGEKFTWNNSVNATLVANNFYCGTTAGGPYPLVWNLVPVNSAFDWLTTDVVNPPIQGTKYFCVVTDIASSGIESGPSNEVFFTFPVVPFSPTGLSHFDH